MVKSLLLAFSCFALSTHGLGAQDSSFAAMQQRGKIAMGVDQYTSIHHFDDLADGGRIRFERDRNDTTGAHAIQVHLRGIAKAFRPAISARRVSCTCRAPPVPLS